MDKFTKEDISLLRKELTDALETVAKNHKLEINLGSIRYFGTEFSTKLSCSCAKGDDGKILNNYEKAYLDRKTIEMRELGEKFSTFDGKRFTICGWKPSNRKYPILAKRKGKIFKFPESFCYRENI